MKKNLWRSYISPSHIPKFPCPKCAVGQLRLTKNNLHKLRPKYVTFEVYEEDPSNAPERFVMFLECADLSCGEVIAVAGEVSTVPAEDQLGNPEWQEYLEPVSMTPPPPIIEIPPTLPDAVFRELNQAFLMYWADYRICASKLRTSLERLMDHFGVAKFRIQKDVRKPTAPGKRKVLDLSARIDKLPKKIGTTDFSETLHALRVIGNLGTHGAKVPKEAMLDAFQLYEMALAKLFEDKSQNAKAIIKRLRAHKG
jgi:hypothetical protein